MREIGREWWDEGEGDGWTWRGVMDGPMDGWTRQTESAHRTGEQGHVIRRREEAEEGSDE